MPSRLITLGITAGALALAAMTVVISLIPIGSRQPMMAAKIINTEPALLKTPPPAPYVSPASVRAIYITSNTALSPARLATHIALIGRTELNAIVINVNDSAKPIPLDQIAAIVRDLNRRGIHTIARIIVFQNEQLVTAHPEFALKTKSGNTWRDRGGHHWIDPASQPAWEEIVSLSEAAVAAGFRELNYDYIRFPSDASRGVVYPAWQGQVKQPRAKVIEEASAYFRSHLKVKHPDLVLSADLFGYSILVDGDTGIGQRFIDLVDNFDVVAPMVYPSHYSTGNFGFKNPAEYPYEVVYGTLKKAEEKLKAAGKSVVLRPWLQDFNLGATYTAAMVRKQMKATTDAGFTAGWMLWNPGNAYTAAALTAE